MIRQINSFLERLSCNTLFAIGLALIPLISVIDFYSHILISFDVLYFVPVAFVAWYCTRKYAIVLSAFAAVGWFFGCLVPERLTTVPLILLWNFIGELTIFLAFVFLISAFKRYLVIIANLARHDPLTNAYNRNAFYRAAEIELSRIRRYGSPFALAYIDIDDFKMVNDEHGHIAGDELLIRVARLLQDNTRLTDLVGRIGGDEFVALLAQTDAANARSTVEKLRSQLAQDSEIKARAATFSIGVITFVKAPATIDQMLNIVDSLMYSVKRNGKNNALYDLWPKAPAA
jgi:diguanylate cyclase (GGDEF)-like protein